MSKLRKSSGIRADSDSEKSNETHFEKLKDQKL